MRIIVEGADGTGKSTVVDFLAEKYQCDVIHMTKWGSRCPADYKAKLKLNNVVSDRSFLSEMIYKTAFDSIPEITLKDLNEFMSLVEKNDWKIIILTASASELKNRLENRGNEDSDTVEKIEYINELYKMYSGMLQLPLIDTSKDDFLNDIVKEIEK